MNYREKVEAKRKAIADTLIQYIESNPGQWESGWYSMPSNAPMNGKTQKKYKGINSFYLAVLASLKGYTDPRWLTFSQAKELGGHVKAGEKSAEVMYWSWYDKATKKPFEDKTVEGMTQEERQKYLDENVRPVLKFYQVFNAQQCENLPEFEAAQTPEMAAEERTRQNALIERVISNSAAPVLHDGGDRAYYSPSSDSIHLPEIKVFKSMQDYYATALHEIAHSTGHESRLNRQLSEGMRSRSGYAKEELCAELASVFMQTELGISVEGKHFENHAAYLAGWLKAVKDDPKEFFAAVTDAEKISDYVAGNYLKERTEEASKSAIEERVGRVEERIQNLEINLDSNDPQIRAMSLMIAADANESGADYKPEYQAALRKIDYDIAIAKLICYENHTDKDKRMERDEQRTLLKAKMLGEYINGAEMSELPDDVRAAHTDYVLSDVDSAYMEEVGNIYNEMQQDRAAQLEVQADKVTEARAAMYATIQNENTALYAVRTEQVPDIDEFDGRETEVERKVPYIINNNGKIESWGTFSPDAQNDKIIATLPYAQQRDYREVSYAELEAAAEAEAAPIRAYADALKEYDRISGNAQRNDYFYLRRAEESLDEYRATLQESKFRPDEIVDVESRADEVEGKTQEKNDLKEVSEDSTVSKGSPLYQEYMSIQTAYPDATVVKRVGDFYEVLGAKAVQAAEKLDLTLTNRDVGLDERVQMIGFPYHNSAQYIAKIREYSAVVFEGENGNEYLPQTEPAEQVEQAEQVGQVGQAEQVGQAQPAEQVEQIDLMKRWLPIELTPDQIGEERGQSTCIKMPKDGEYSSFVFFVPTKLLRRDEKSGKVKVSVNSDFKYDLIHDGLQVELTGLELCGALAGKEIGKSAQRVAASRMNRRRLTSLAENVPDEMRLLPNWCAYKTRWNNEKGKKDKFVLSPIDGKWAKSSDPATWTDFETAMEFAQRNNCEGLAFALDGKSGISCIDLDHSINEGGELTAPAKRLTDEISDTYTETSVSGNGIHIFVKDDILSKGKYKNRTTTSEGEIEVYDTGRFISMTGNIRSKTTQLGKCPVATTQWLRGTLGEKVSERQVQPRQRPGGIDTSDEAVIERIRKSKRGWEFEALFRGEDLTGDNSRNDFKMMNMLAFFTDCDKAQMERIFKTSGLYRPEKGQPYVQRSIDKACTTLTSRMSDRAFGSGRSHARGNSK